MKILLLQDIKGVGRRMDVKDVKDGFARNFLFTRRLAVLADKKALALKSEQEKKSGEEMARLNESAKKLEAMILEFQVKTGEKGEVFGSVTGSDIEKELENKGVRSAKVLLKHHLKTLGEHEVEVDLGHGIKGKVKIVLKQSSS